MAITQTPPIRTGCASSKSVQSEYWINKDNGHWMIGNKDTGIDASGIAGKPGITPRIGVNNNWWIGDIDTGVPASGNVEMPSPESATDLFD